ncbi:UNVERIFIED_CONTAM: hypothetical protein HDU68_010407 [Siphonaria sp. JEL0065]|nr:hypothetical protein HDU68_010407 [Siphonaria sp. JEL0065]
MEALHDNEPAEMEAKTLQKQYVKDFMGYLGDPFLLLDARRRYIVNEITLFDVADDEPALRIEFLNELLASITAAPDQDIPLYIWGLKALKATVIAEIENAQSLPLYSRGLISKDFNPFWNLLSYFEWSTIQVDSDLLSHMDRCERLAEQFELVIPNLQESLKANITMSRRTVERLIKYCHDISNSNPAASPFCVPPYAQSPGAYATVDFDKHKDNLIHIVENIFHGGLKDLARFLESEYMPYARASPGIYGLPDYEEAYQKYIHHYCFTNQSASEIHDIGITEIDRIQQEMRTVMSTLKQKGSIQEFATSLRDRRQFPQLFESDFKAAFGKFGTLCDAAFEASQQFTFMSVRRSFDYELFCDIIQEDPKLESKSPLAYLRWAPDMGLAFVINLKKLVEVPNHQWEAIILNQLYPGVFHQWENVVDISNSTHFAHFEYRKNKSKGWAEYAESCGQDLGFYKDPFQLFGHLERELLNAILLVVDTGLHSKGWSLGKAVGFINEHAAYISEEDALEHVLECCDSPGKALGPKMGALRIRKLRKRVEKEFDFKKSFALGEYKGTYEMGFNQVVIDTEFLRGDGAMEECMDYTIKYWKNTEPLEDGDLTLAPADLG